INILRRNWKRPWCPYTGEGLLEVEIGVIRLDPEVAPIGDIHEPLLCIHGDAVHRVELIRARPTSPNRLYPGAVLHELDDAGVVIAVRHEDIVLRIPGKVSLPVECAYVSNWKVLDVFLAAFHVF